jgi:hypothetical protein
MIAQIAQAAVFRVVVDSVGERPAGPVAESRRLVEAFGDKHQGEELRWSVFFGWR